MTQTSVHYAPPSQSNQVGLAGDYWKVLGAITKDIFAQNPTRLALIDLTPLRNMMITTWDQMETDVRQIIENSSNDLLNSGDLLVHFNNAAYLLIISETQSSGANDLAAEIARQIEKNLLGMEQTNKIIQVTPISSVEEDGLCIPETEAIDVSNLAVPPSIANKKENAKKHLMVLGDADYSLVPVWDVRRNIVLCYRLNMSWMTEDGRTEGESQLEQLKDPVLELALDIESLHKAAKEIEDVYDEERFASFILPVHFDTLASEKLRNKYLEAAAQLGPVSPERMYFEVERVPNSVDRDKLSEMIAQFRVFYHGVLTTVDLDFDSFAMLQGNSIYSVGIDLEHDERPETEIMKDLEAFIAKVSRYPLRTHVLGLKSMSLTVAAVCAGFDFVGGHPVSTSLEGWEPDDYLMKPMDLYKKLISSEG